MHRHVILATRVAGRGAFKGIALLAALFIVAATWWWDAPLLTMLADENLLAIKTSTGFLPADWGAKVESALRLFGADRALLVIEAVTVAKLVMLAAAYPFRRRV